MEYVKTFENFLTESSIKIPARIKDVDEIDQYFWPYEANKVKEIWGSNNGIILPAKNDKSYKIKYISKGGNKYLQLELVK